MDPLVTAIGVSILGAVAAGPAVAFGLRLLPEHWHKVAQWLLIGGAVSVAVVADLVTEGPGGGGVIVYVLAVLPGVIAYLAFRTLLASAFVSLAPLYFVIAILTRGRTTYTPSLSLDDAFSLQPAWMLVYGSLYVFVVLLPVLVVRQAALFRRALQGYLLVMLVAYVGFLLYPTAAPRPDHVIGDGFAAWALRLAYDLDPPYNCFPSLHVAYSFVSALTCYRVHRGVGVVAVLWAALIGLSTLDTKQHYAVDVIAGALMAFVAYALFLRSYPREAVDARDRRLAPRRTLVMIGFLGIMIAGYWIAYRFQTR